MNLEKVVKAGLQYADDVEVYSSKSVIRSVTGTYGTLKAESTVDQGIGIRVQVDGKVGSAFTTGTDYEECVRQAVSIARCKRERVDLEFSCSNVPAVAGLYSKETAHITIEECIAHVSGLLNIDIPVQGSLEIREMVRAVCNSSGLDISEKGTFADLSLNVQGACSVSEDRCSRSFQRLGCETLLEDLVDRARQPPEGKARENCTIILSPEAVSLLFSVLVCPAVCADNVLQKQSFLRGLKGELVASEKVTIRDDATLAGGLVSRSFDAEGTPSRCVSLVEQGRLCGFLHNLTTARCAGNESTGNAFRDYRTEPIVFPSNVIIQHEEQLSFDELIEETRKGILVRGIIGAYSSDYITGDFSVTLDECSLVESGTLKRIENVSIGGNVFSLLRSIECVSKEVVQSGHLIAPWVKIEALESNSY